MVFRDFWTLLKRVSLIWNMMLAFEHDAGLCGASEQILVHELPFVCPRAYLPGVDALGSARGRDSFGLPVAPVQHSL